MVTVDPSVLQATLMGHSDAVWGLSMHNSKMQLLSCSSDATVRLWNPNVKSPLLSTFRIDTGTLIQCASYITASFFHVAIFFTVVACAAVWVGVDVLILINIVLCW